MLGRRTNSSTHTDHSSRSEPINDTRFRRFLTLASINVVKHFQDRSDSVLNLSPGICVKRGNFRDLAEACTLRFIAQHTSIPVPKVYCSFRRKGTTYIVMERIYGRMATIVWNELSDKAREKIMMQLKKLIGEMRAVPAPSDRIANVNGGSLWDCRLHSNLDRFGPFEDTDSFHSFLRNGIDKAPPGIPEIGELIEFQSGQLAKPVLTHGDLSSLNILIREEDIVGIIDWETSGWYPPYWEYVSACQVNPRNYFWRDYIDTFLEPFPDALKHEPIRLRWWGAI